MKLSILFTAATLLVSQHAFAECNTVMGGCVKEDAVNVAPHMRSENNKPAIKPKAATAPVDKNIKNADASSNQSAKPATKKM
ncbi:MAG: hypothetical protein Q8R74_03975 [Methylophilus sp.]|nr:hypothetical protein [Methylophilus sp.]MDP3608211.1 hypothetical protein [Methylophilus sp.]